MSQSGTNGKKTVFGKIGHSIFESMAFRVGFTPVVTLLLFLILIFGVAVPFVENSIMDAKRVELEDLVDGVIHVIDYHRELALTGEISMEDAQKESMSIVKQMRYGVSESEYFWINDMGPNMVMHPYRTDLDGTDISTFEDPTGKRLFVEFVHTVQKSSEGEGYVDYMWQWHANEDLIVPKISYVKLYEPWDWIVGTGVYIEDAKAQIDVVVRTFVLSSFAIFIIVLVVMIMSAARWGKIERERIEVNKKLTVANNKLKNVFKVKNEFLNQVAHDLRSPLTPILLLIESFDSSKMSASDREKFVVIHRNAKNLLFLINDVLNIARLDRPTGMKFNMVRGNLSDVVHNLVRDQMIFFESNKIDLKLNIIDTPDVLMDVERMKEVIANLFSNAVKYINYKGKKVKNRISIDLSFDSNYVYCIVKDNGMGLNVKSVKNIFRRFYVAKESHVSGSIGLGLYICKSLVKKHKGDVWAKSHGVHKGLEIGFKLPIMKA